MNNSTEIRSLLLDDAWAESDPVRGARTYIERARNALLERHRAGASGREIVTAYTTLIDRLIIRVFQAASEDYVLRYPSFDPRCALVAQGGYGRCGLNPQSDIHLLFLYNWKVTPYVEAVTEKAGRYPTGDSARSVRI